MTEKKEPEPAPRVKLLQKMRAFREALITQYDWTADGMMKIQGATIKYISVTQIKQALAPLFHKFGLELEPTMQQPTYIPDTRQWLVGVSFVWIDTDTGETLESTFYSAAMGDKGIVVAESYALKMYLTTKFCLADGIDPDREGTATQTSSFVPRSAKEKEEMTSKVLSKGISPAEHQPAPAQTTVQKKADPAPTPTQTPTAQATKPAPAPAPAPEPTSAPAHAPAPATGTKEEKKSTVSGMQKRAIDNIIERYMEQLTGGEIDTDTVKAIKAEAEACMTPDQARAFITKYRS